MKKILTFNLLIFLLLCFQSLSAADMSYYVSVYGNDGTGNGSSTNPWRTIQHAVNQCTTSADDYTIYIAANPLINQNGSGKEYYNEHITIGSGLSFSSLTITGPDMEHFPEEYYYDDDEDNLVILEKARIHGSITINKSNVIIEELRIFNTQAVSESNLISIGSGVSNVLIDNCYVGPLCSTTLKYGFMRKYYNNQWVWAWVPNDGLNQYYEPWIDWDSDITMTAAGKHGIFVKSNGEQTSGINIENSMIYYITGDGEAIYLKAPKPDENSNSLINDVLINNNYIMMNRRSGIVAAGNISGLTLLGNSISFNGWYPEYFGIEDNGSSAEYGNGLVLFDGGLNDASKRSDLSVSSSFYANRSTGIYIFGGAESITINDFTDIWGNKDGIFLNYDTEEPGHPISTTNYTNNNFSDIKINQSVIFANKRFGIFYNTNDPTKCIDAQNNYFEEPPTSTGWNGYDESFGPTYAWGTFDHGAAKFYGQSGVNYDGGRNSTNSGSDFYADDPDFTRPSLVYGPVDINPYMFNLGTNATRNLKADNSNTNDYFDNIPNALKTLTLCSKDIIEVEGTTTNYTDYFTIPYPVEIKGTGTTKPTLGQTSTGTETLISSTSTGNSEINNFKLQIPTSGFKYGNIDNNTSYTGDVYMNNINYFLGTKQIYCYNEMNAYITDGRDYANGVGEFVINTVCEPGETVLWLDASFINRQSVTTDTLMFWPDRSDSLNHATQTELNFLPQWNSSGGINGNPYVQFNNCTDKRLYDYMITPSSTSLNRNSSKTLFIVFTTNGNITTEQFLFESGSQQNGYCMFIARGNLYFGIYRRIGNTDASLFLRYSGLSTETNYLARMYFDLENSTFGAALNEHQAVPRSGSFSAWTNDPTNSPGGIGITYSGGKDTAGAIGNTNYPFCGSLSEILLYNAYSDTKYTQVMEYLNEKYGFNFNTESWPRTGVESSDWAYIENNPLSEFQENQQLSLTYPSPFNNSSSFSVMLKKTQNVTIDLFDALGNKVYTYYQGVLNADRIYDYTIDGSNLPPGLYIYRLSGEDFTESGKVVLVK